MISITSRSIRKNRYKRAIAEHLAKPQHKRGPVPTMEKGSRPLVQKARPNRPPSVWPADHIKRRDAGPGGCACDRCLPF